MYQVLFCLTDQHDWRLVALGGAVCMLASAAAISLFHRARATQGPGRLVWISLDAVVSGCGDWVRCASTPMSNVSNRTHALFTIPGTGA